MPATIERLVDLYQLRGGPEHYAYGDPYAYSATLTVSGKTCMIKGLSGQVTPKLRDDLYDVLKELGVEVVCFERYKNGCVSEHQCRIKDL